ncbi:LOW QUALITY PROTEIN: hypothetical protein Cgig2_000626 [Carnegiea gigantea]|uniref:Uncharacterized protein n=1 Tax=Carnegiea gigantea TaxID=171969 RepID=A0A9Q1QG69_9CARY|nr:LOW QUALITY PROTEIN: hypothetical protein Cgig2_000626 [Carnegiea gigantea]
MGMIRLPLCFGDKEKVRTLEVDFLVIDVPTAYNIIPGRPALHKFEADDGSVGTMQRDQRMAREERVQTPMEGKGPERRITKSKQKHPKALGIGIFVMVTAVSCPDLIALLARSHGLAIQWHSLLIAIFTCGRKDKLYQLKVPTLDLDLTAILYIPDVRFKVAFYAEGLGHQELPKELDTLFASSPVALTLGPSLPLLFDLYLQVSSLGLQGLLLLLQLLQAAPVLSHCVFRLLALCLEIVDLPPQKGIRALEAVDQLLQGRNRRPRPRHLQHLGKGLESTLTRLAKEEQPGIKENNMNMALP